MLFSLKRIFHNIRRRAAIYIVFILEFAVGTTVLSSALNTVFSLQDELNKAKEKMQGSIIEIEAHGTHWSDPATEIWVKPWEQEISLSYDNYLRLKQIYGGDLDILYALSVWQWEGVFIKDKENQVDDFSFDVCFVNNEKFRELFGSDMEPGKIYAGDNAYEKLMRFAEYKKDPKYVYGTDILGRFPPPIDIQNGRFILSRENEYELLHNPETDRTDFINNYRYDNPPQLSDEVFVPIEEFKVYRDLLRREFNPYNNYYEDVTIVDGDGVTELYTVYRKLHTPQPICNFYLSVEIINPEADVNTIPSMLTFLNGLKRDTEFTLSQELLELQGTADLAYQSLIMQIINAVSVMLIVVLGTTGLFLIFLYKRKKEMAVSIAYGSTRKRLFFEIFSEVLFVTGIGTALGIFALKYYKASSEAIYAAAGFYPASVIIPIAAALVCSFITAGLSFVGIGEVAPAEILKDL